MKQQTWRNLKICALNMSAETFEVRRGAGQAWSWPSTELVSHGAVAGGSWLHALEGRICSYTYNEARNYLSAQVVPANQTECTYKVQTENGFPLRFFLWNELYFLARLAPSLSWWKKGRPLFHSPSACHWHREHSGALALVLGSSVGFTPWAVVEAVETSLRSFLYWNVKTVCVEWDFSGYGGHVLVPAVHLRS